MNGPLFGRTIAANWVRLLACAIGLVVWGLFLPIIYKAFGQTVSELVKGNPLFEQFSQFGGGDLFSLSGAMAIGFIHPITLLLMGVIAIGLPVISIAGERQRGTLEVLLARPISRHTIYVTLFVAGALMLASLMALDLIANVVSATVVGVIGEIQVSNVPILWLDGVLLFVAFMAVGFAASVSFDRVGPPLGITIGFVLVNYFIDVIGSLWPDAAWIRDWTLFHLVQSKSVLEGEVEPSSFALLVVIIGIAVGYAWIVFPRRDIAAPS